MKRFCYFLAITTFVAWGCSGTSADPEQVQDGLVFERSVVAGKPRVTIHLADSEAGPIAFPATGSLCVHEGNARWNLDGTRQASGRSKRRLWGFGDLAVLHPGMAVSFDYVAKPSGKVVVDVPPQYLREVEVALAREGVHLWSGKVTIGEG